MKELVNLRKIYLIEYYDGYDNFFKVLGTALNLDSAFDFIRDYLRKTHTYRITDDYIETMVNSSRELGKDCYFIGYPDGKLVYSTDGFRVRATDLYFSKEEGETDGK